MSSLSVTPVSLERFVFNRTEIEKSLKFWCRGRESNSYARFQAQDFKFYPRLFQTSIKSPLYLSGRGFTDKNYIGVYTPKMGSFGGACHSSVTWESSLA